MNPWAEAAIIAPTCLTAGFVLGVLYTHRKLAREVAVQVNEVKAWSRRWWQALVGVFVILCACLTAWSSATSQNADRGSRQAVAELSHQSQCLTSYANQLYDSLNPRQRANERLQNADKRFKRADQVFAEALSQLLADALDPNSSVEVRTNDAIALQRATEAKAAALKHANYISRRLEVARDQNPYPPPPKEVCPKRAPDDSTAP